MKTCKMNRWIHNYIDKRTNKYRARRMINIFSQAPRCSRDTHLCTGQMTQRDALLLTHPSAPRDALLFTSSATPRDTHLFTSPATPCDAHILTSPAAHRGAPFCRRPRDKPATHISPYVPRHTRDTYLHAAHRDTKRNTKPNVFVEFLRTHPAISSAEFENDRHANPTKLQRRRGKDR